MGAVLFNLTWLLLTKLRGKILTVEPESKTQGNLHRLTYTYIISRHILLLLLGEGAD